VQAFLRIEEHATAGDTHAAQQIGDITGNLLALLPVALHRVWLAVFAIAADAEDQRDIQVDAPLFDNGGGFTALVDRVAGQAEGALIAPGDLGVMAMADHPDAVEH